MDKPVFVLVDAYSTGNYLPHAFYNINAAVVHVQSTYEFLPTMLPPNLENFEANIVHRGIASTCEKLRHFKPVAVLTGQESGVNLADELSEEMGLMTNGTRLSPARRNKYLMIEQLRTCGIRTAQQLKTTNLSEARHWVGERADGAYVVKPLSSASTDGVFICSQISDLDYAFEYILSSKDIFDNTNTEVLVQSYLVGTEYIVDTVSSCGHHYICGIWRYQKIDLPNGKRIYDKDILVSHEDPLVEELGDYVRSVLDALNIDHGPSHAEIIMTNKGPTLVEIGARLNGNMHPQFHDQCLGHNQADLTAQAYASPTRFIKEYGGQSYRVKKPAVVMNTATAQQGTISGFNQGSIDQIRKLESVYSLSVKFSIGKLLKPTDDLLSSPLRVFLIGSTYDQIFRDCETIERKKDEVYTLHA